MNQYKSTWKIAIFFVIVTLLGAVLEAAPKSKPFRADFLKSGLGQPVLSMKVISHRDKIPIWMVTFNDGSVAAYSQTELQSRQQAFTSRQQPSVAPTAEPVTVVFAQSPAAESLVVPISYRAPVAAPPTPQFKTYGRKSKASCEGLSRQERASVQQAYGVDLNSYILKAVMPLHLGGESNRDQKSQWIRDQFAVDGWTKPLRAHFAAQGSSAAQMKQLETATAQIFFGYYTSFILSYISLEQKYVDVVGLTSTEREHVLQNPVEPRVRRVQERTCPEPQRKLGLCRRDEVVLDVTTQMSPLLTCHCDNKAQTKNISEPAEVCSDWRFKDDYRAHYILEILPQGGFRILDVMVGDFSLAWTTIDQILSVGLERSLGQASVQ